MEMELPDRRRGWLKPRLFERPPEHTCELQGYGWRWSCLIGGGGDWLPEHKCVMQGHGWRWSCLIGGGGDWLPEHICVLQGYG